MDVALEAGLLMVLSRVPSLYDWLTCRPMRVSLIYFHSCSSAG